MPSLWRNRLARSAVNRKVGGSSPPRDDLVLHCITYITCRAVCIYVQNSSLLSHRATPASNNQEQLVVCACDALKCVFLYLHNV